MIKPKRQQNIDSFLGIDIYTNGSYRGAGLCLKLEVTITSNNRGRSKDSIEHYVPINLLLQMS